MEISNDQRFHDFSKMTSQGEEKSSIVDEEQGKMEVLLWFSIISKIGLHQSLRYRERQLMRT